MKRKKPRINLGVVILILIIVITIIFIINKVNKKEKNVNINAENISSDENNQNANFKVKDIKCKNGDEISIEIELLNDSEFVAANFEYKYDSKALEYINYELGDSIKDGTMTVVNDDKANEKVLIGCIVKPDSESTIKPGKIIDIKFKVKESLSINKIENLFNCTTLKEKDGTDIKFNIQQGIIEIK